jgi:CPW-WPC domain-containing protein
MHARDMHRVGFLSLLCCGLGAAQPVFPEGVGELMSAMNTETQKIDFQNSDEGEVLKVLEQHAAKELQEDLLESEMQSGLSQAAYAAARLRLQKLEYLGGCPRDMHAKCPAGWSESEGVCKPPPDYDGRCADIAFTDISSAADKESFSWRCQAAWPCTAACKKTFAHCPEAWVGVGRLCVAPFTYSGICSPAMDFTTFTVEEKVQWSAMCAADWPCI